MPVKNRFADLQDEITKWRRHLHENPELMYEVHKTAGFVEERLKEFGLTDITTGIGRTGVVAVIEGKTNTSGRVIGLRADMDALPITEASGVDYASKTPGVMHACGHDGHTSILLGAAKYLSETRNFDGKVVLIFQPAEEGGAGGKAMCDDGLMERWGIQEVYGLHNMPGLPVGQFAIRPGALLASSDEFEITVTGKGGHAAAPHDAIDTTLVASQIVVSLHSIVSRNVNPVKRVVLTVGTFETDSTASNVIAHTARLQGTVRTLDTEYRQQAEGWVRQIAENVAAAYGAEAKVEWSPGYPVTINTEEETGYAVEAARAVSADVVDNTDPIMPSEDFAYMLEERPGAYMFLGNGDTAMCHHPAYVFDDNAIPLGCSWFAELVERRMPAA
ncbi:MULTISPECIES: M20 aminoacylase family protein [Rhodobacterales]|jgi:hippurate hydrolase|uniref:M20 family metallopeptidase n=1 Tax=Phaeobacter gallaeciensis TaxID=60890 RepID=A0ABD4X3Y7_9RHOB|nr:M20 aminoacylase family protein [Phaeobacter gallaeciensis]MDF1770620.1 M20 family metallopeptidase [Pseudophaeobacter sp. bin_em_oilr2.035]MDE4095918.1 M20 family metallopeptidase [Phaeobacter gallaeciensis]MDE4104729.1 M20 family metallopeptidase [Phaeobacter gallaeciensis]MDE4109186.1 M20 family metallopeptidase [Phaeobacter gallaeciensis]MDE4113653.1 M20 family metallopeptidase [Phaeobacter gallaeciensis]